MRTLAFALLVVGCGPPVEEDPPFAPCPADGDFVMRALGFAPDAPFRRAFALTDAGPGRLSLADGERTVDIEISPNLGWVQPSADECCEVVVPATTANPPVDLQVNTLDGAFLFEGRKRGAPLETFHVSAGADHSFCEREGQRTLFLPVYELDDVAVDRTARTEVTGTIDGVPVVGLVVRAVESFAALVARTTP